jgi:hypothetical protein
MATDDELPEIEYVDDPPDSEADSADSETGTEVDARRVNIHHLRTKLKAAEERIAAHELERATFVRHFALVQKRLDNVVGYCAKLQGIEMDGRLHTWKRDPVPRELFNP